MGIYAGEVKFQAELMKIIQKYFKAKLKMRHENQVVHDNSGFTLYLTLPCNCTSSPANR